MSAGKRAAVPDPLDALVARAEGVLARFEALLPPVAPDPDWAKVTAARWRKRGDRGWLAPVVDTRRSRSRSTGRSRGRRATW
ncbi:MAG: hypothetical protein IPF73_18045 [Betaproteobacteria bacterium]|nr:hypothetical protein [Betaproteobacteria bacterium]